MPELPEVETIARGLQAAIAGRTVTATQLLGKHAVHGDQHRFLHELPGSRILRVHRRGKLLLLDFDSKLKMAVHLKMTGRLFIPEPKLQPDKHTHVVFHLSPAPQNNDAGRMYYHDVRKFGYLQLFTQNELETWDFFSTLGPEPLEMNEQDFLQCLESRKGAIKGVILNQRVIAGIGNIYADESLFRAGLRPDARTSDISPQKRVELFTILQTVLQQAIDECGSSLRDYRDAHGNAGAFQNNFRAYGRVGEPCLRCGASMESTKVAGRTSTYCPKCQK